MIPEKVTVMPVMVSAPPSDASTGPSEPFVRFPLAIVANWSVIKMARLSGLDAFCWGEPEFDEVERLCVAGLLGVGEELTTETLLTVCKPPDEEPAVALEAAGGPFAAFKVWVNCCVIVLPETALDEAEIVCVPVPLGTEFAVAVVV